MVSHRTTLALLLSGVATAEFCGTKDVPRGLGCHPCGSHPSTLGCSAKSETLVEG